MAEERKCSLKAIKEYDNAIKDYLKSKNITDFNNYEISLKEGKLHYIKWGYSIEKPTNIIPSKQKPNYLDLYPRLLTIKITDNEEYKCFNCDGDEIINPKTYTDIHNRTVQTIYEKSKYANDRWVPIVYNNEIYVWEGLLTFDKKITGFFNVIIFYRINNPDIIIPVSSTQYYTIPKELLNNKQVVQKG